MLRRRSAKNSASRIKIAETKFMSDVLKPFKSRMSTLTYI